jgi:hypothetical protein
LRILFVGDVMGKPGRKGLAAILPRLTEREGVDLVVVNGENSAGGLGITPATAQDIFKAGADLITTGNHVWKHKEIYEYLNAEPRIVRPANFPEGAPGRGHAVFQARSGKRVGVLNLQGRVFMEAIECPFRTALKELEALSAEGPEAVIVDFHAEATSEKLAMGYFLEGRVAAVLGTHTHVQTSDERILPGGTAYISDCGMTGPVADSVIGMTRKPVTERFLTGLPQPFEVATKGVELQGVVVEIDGNGRAVSISRVREPLPE